MPPDERPRRGWRERVDGGLYRAHAVSCPRSADRRAAGRCGCPFQFNAPGARPGRTRTVTVRGSLTEARAERRRLLAAGRPIAPAVPAPTELGTVHALAVDWFRAGAPRWSPATIAARDHAYRVRIAPRFGSAPLESLTRPQVEAWAADLLGAGHGRRAVEIAVETLRAMLAVALQAALVDRNAAARVRLPEAPPPERTAGDRVVDLDGAAQLVAACRDVRQETIVRAALEAGLRRGEIVALRWPDVRLDDRRIIVRRSVYQDGRVGKVERRPKMGRVGRVAISPSFAEALARWYGASVVEGGASAEGFVWPGRDGASPMSPSSVSHLIGKVGRRAGLVDARGRHLAHLHGLRHSAGSIAIAEGVPLTVVAAQLRHARPDFTARTYSHLLGDEQLDRFAAAHGPRTPRETPREPGGGVEKPLP